MSNVMKHDWVRNARLTAATTLLSLWGHSHLAQTPMLGDTAAPLIVALLIAPGVGWNGRGSYRFMLLALIAFAAITVLLFRSGSEAELQSFSQSPWFVVPVWALCLFGLVRNATAAERLQAPTQAPSAAPGATLRADR